MQIQDKMLSACSDMQPPGLGLREFGRLVLTVRKKQKHMHAKIIAVVINCYLKRGLGLPVVCRTLKHLSLLAPNSITSGLFFSFSLRSLLYFSISSSWQNKKGWFIQMNHQRWKWFNTCHIQMGDILFPWGSAKMELRRWFHLCRLYQCVRQRGWACCLWMDEPLNHKPVPPLITVSTLWCKCHSLWCPLWQR